MKKKDGWQSGGGAGHGVAGSRRCRGLAAQLSKAFQQAVTHLHRLSEDKQSWLETSPGRSLRTDEAGDKRRDRALRR